jgi:hypothetical protein
MTFTTGDILRFIASCDERIASIEGRLNKWNTYDIALRLAANIFKTEEEKSVFNIEDENAELIKTYKNNIKLIKVEKLIYWSLGKGDKGEIFSKLLAKYDELMGLSYDLSANMVRLGRNQEADHINYCKSSLKQREYICQMCSYGKNR